MATALVGRAAERERLAVLVSQAVRGPAPSSADPPL